MYQYLGPVGATGLSKSGAGEPQRRAAYLPGGVWGSANPACSKLGPAPYDPVIDPANFVDKIDNPYFPLVPGTDFVYEGDTSSGLVHVDFIVTHNTKQILGVTTTEVHDIVRTNGEVTEDTLDWFAQ